MSSYEAVLRLVGPDIDQDRLTVPEAGLRIGRGSNNDVVINHPQISKAHLYFAWAGDQFLVEDLDSTNGTFVNETRIAAFAPQTLAPGDVVRAGPFYLIVEDVRVVMMPEPVPEPYLDVMRDVLDRMLGSEPPPEPPELADFAPALERRSEGEFPIGIPRPEDGSSWLQYLPAIFSDPGVGDPVNGVSNDFIGRFLLIFESIFAPIIWQIDHFDLNLSPGTASDEWLHWLAGWFDILLLPQLGLERKRMIVASIGWLYSRRGTRTGLERLLELYFDTRPEIIEYPENSHFVVRLPAQRVKPAFDDVALQRLIESSKPAFTTFEVVLT